MRGCHGNRVSAAFVIEVTSVISGPAAASAIASRARHNRSSPLESPPTNGDPGRGRGTRSVTAAEKAQAHEVSLRRIGRLFAPYGWQMATVTAIIVASSLVGVVSPFLLMAAIDTALPESNVRLLAPLVTAMIRLPAVP